MEQFEENDFFSALARSGARILLIGRRALIALGIPVLTSDYDLWICGDAGGTRWSVAREAGRSLPERA